MTSEEDCPFYFFGKSPDKKIGLEEYKKKNLTDRLYNAALDFEHFQLTQSIEQSARYQFLELVKNIVIVFLPDKVICAVGIIENRSKLTLAANIPLIVYEEIQKKIPNKANSQKFLISIKNIWEILNLEIEVKDVNFYRKRNIIDWCFKEVELIQTMAAFDREIWEGKNLFVEIFLPYSIKELERIAFYNHFRSLFFDRIYLSKEEFKTYINNIQYVDCSEEFAKRGTFNVEDFPVMQNAISKIEREIKQILNINEQEIFTFKHIKNIELRKSNNFQSPIPSHILKQHGFYVHFIPNVDEKRESLKSALRKYYGKNFNEGDYENQWNYRVVEFQQGDDIGGISISRFTFLPEFDINLESDPRIAFYRQLEESPKNYDEKVFYKKQKNNEKYLFPPFLHSYIVLPIIISAWYWGCVVIFMKKEALAAEEYYKKIRKICFIANEIFLHAEEVIISDFINFSSRKLLTHHGDFSKGLKEVKEYAKFIPLLPKIYFWDDLREKLFYIMERNKTVEETLLRKIEGIHNELANNNINWIEDISLIDYFKSKIFQDQIGEQLKIGCIKLLPLDWSPGRLANFTISFIFNQRKWEIPFRTVVKCDLLCDFMQSGWKGNQMINKAHKMATLLSDFQHILLKSFGNTQAKAIQFMDNNKEDNFSISDKNIQYIRTRGEYLETLSRFIKGEDVADDKDFVSDWNICEEQLTAHLFTGEILFFISEDDLNPTNAEWEEAKAIWENILTIGRNFEFQTLANGNFNKFNDWEINKPAGAIFAILEQLIHNSLIKLSNRKLNEEECISFKEWLKNHNIYINFETNTEGRKFISYWDTGVGFNRQDASSIQRWLQQGPSEEEEKIRKGYGYWLIGRISEKEEIDINIVAKNRANQTVITNYMQYSKGSEALSKSTNKVGFGDFLDLDNLKDENLRVIHYLLF